MDLKTVLMESFVKYIVPVAFTGLAAVLTLAFTKLIKLLDAKKDESKLAAFGAKIGHLGVLTVRDLEATLKPMLIEASKDGKLTKEEFQQLREAGVGRLKMLLGEHGIKELGSVLGVVGEMAVNAYLGGVVEQQVAALAPGVVVEQPASPPVAPGGLPLGAP